MANDESRFSDAKRYFQQALQQSEQLIELRQSASHRGLSWAHRFELDVDTALYEAKRARYEADYMQGIILEESARYQDAERLYHSALTVADEIGYQHGLAKTANSLSILFAIQGKYVEAKSQQAHAHQLARQLDLARLQCETSINLAFIHNMSGEYKEALAHLQELRTMPAMAHMVNSPVIAAHLHYHTAEAYLGLVDIEHAEAATMAALQLEEEDLMADCQRILSELALLKGDYFLAEKIICQVLERLIPIEMANLYTYGYAKRVLARILFAVGRLDEANTVKKEAIDAFTEIGLAHEAERTRLIGGE